MNVNWKRFNKYLYRYWKLQVVVILLGFISLPLSLLNPYLTKLVIDKAYANKDLKLFLILAIIGGGIFVINGLINSLISYLSSRINLRVRFDITKDLFRHLQSLPLSFFNDKSTGEHIYRISNDVSSVSGLVSNTLPQIPLVILRLVSLSCIVFYLNWKLAFFTFILAPLSFIHPYFFGKWLKQVAYRIIDKSQDIYRNLQEVFSHMHLVKALGKEEYEIKRFEESLLRRTDFEFKNARIRSMSSFSSSILDKLISGVILLYGGYQVIRGDLTLGSLTALMIYLTQALGAFRSMAGFYENIFVNSVSYQRLAEILDRKTEIMDKEGAAGAKILKGKIEFQDVHFTYQKDGFVLKGLNFTIKPGSKIALIGKSGCGKTTLLSLILRLYNLEKGSILIDGQDIKDVKLKSLKGQIGICLQEALLWNDTLANNILYGKDDASYEEMVKAAKIAEIDKFIFKLPQGYDSLIGEMACKLSEGQKQRIAIARTVIKRPSILILDEAMSSLDSETEEKIIDNIKNEFGDSTIIVVSHRLSTVKKMELAYFLESPSDISIGRHEELLRSPGYRELFASQIEAAPEEEIIF